MTWINIWEFCAHTHDIETNIYLNHQQNHTACQYRASERDVCIAHINECPTNTYEMNGVRALRREYNTAWYQAKNTYTYHSGIEICCCCLSCGRGRRNLWIDSNVWLRSSEAIPYTSSYIYFDPFRARQFSCFLCHYFVAAFLHVAVTSIVYSTFDIATVCSVTFACICKCNTSLDIELFVALLLLLLLLLLSVWTLSMDFYLLFVFRTLKGNLI